MATEMDLLMVLSARDQASGVLRELSTTLEQLGVSFGQVARQGSLAGSILNGIGTPAQRLGVGLTLVGAGLVGIGVAAGEALKGFVDDATQYDAAITNIQNNTNMSTEDTQRMHDAILQLAQDTGASLDQLEQGYMHVMNVTQNAAIATDILRIATESAVSTGGDAGMTANILANAMHEYGLDVSHAATETERHNEIVANATRIMGQLHLAAAEANATLEQYSESTSRAIAVGANFHVPFDQTLAALTALSKHGFPDMHQAAIQVQDVMLKMAEPTKQAEKELERLTKLTGVDLVHDFSASGLASKGLQGVLEDLHTAFTRMGLSEAEASAEAMKLINAQRGGIGLSVLLGTAWEDEHKILADLNNQQLVNTITEESMDRTKATLANQQARLNETLKVTGIIIGETLVPALSQMLAQVMPIITRVTDWAKANPQLVATILEVVAVGGVLLGTLMAVAGVALVLGAAFSPIGLVLMGLTAAVIAIGVAWATNFLGIRDATASVVTFVTTNLPRVRLTAEQVWTAVQMVVQRVLAFLAPFILSILNQVTNWWINNHTQIQAAAQRVWAAIQAVIAAVMPVIQAVIATGIAAISAYWQVEWTIMQTVLEAAWKIIRIIIETTLQNIGSIIMIGVDIINGDWQGAWDEFHAIIQRTWDATKETVRIGVNAIIGLLDDFIDAWNGLHLSIPGFSVTIPSITVPGVGTVGGGTLSWGGFSEGVGRLPHIPMLQEGGLILEPTLALLGEAGPEAVVPLSEGVGAGQTVIFDFRGSQVMSDRDIDLLIDKIDRRLPSRLSAAGVQVLR